MIDVENKVLNTVFDAVRAGFPTTSCYGEYVLVPSAFPCICIYESDSETYTYSNDEQLHEHQARVTYECNVYSDDADDKKQQAKAIADIVDRAMQSMLFVRTFRSQIPNQDRTIYRVTLRWQAVVGEPITESDGNITYQMYRDRVR
jgi:hypothetical protein